MTDSSQQQRQRRWTEQELNSLRHQLYSLDHMNGYHTIQIRESTDKALIGISHRLPGEKKSYDELIMMCVDAYHKLNPDSFTGLPEPSLGLEEDQDG